MCLGGFEKLSNPLGHWFEQHTDKREEQILELIYSNGFFSIQHQNIPNLDHHRLLTLNPLSRNPNQPLPVFPPLRQSHTVSPTSSLLVLLPFPPLHRRQAHHLLPAQLRRQHPRNPWQLRPLQLHLRPNPSHHGRHGSHSLPHRLRLRPGFMAPQVLTVRFWSWSAPHLIKAHLAVRPGLKRVIIWNRTEEKARALAAAMKGSVGGVEFESNARLDEAVAMGDIVSCATNSEVALKVGAHLDLVGSFQHSMECDNEAIRRRRVFVDNEAALVEAGELVGAFERGVIGKGDGGVDRRREGGEEKCRGDLSP